MSIYFKGIIFSLLIFFSASETAALPSSSPRRQATGDFSDDVYDTYDYLTVRPDLLKRLEGWEIVLYPDELIQDIPSLVSLIHGDPQLHFNNRIGLAYHSGRFGFGLHFLNRYVKKYAQNPSDTAESQYSDTDNDGIFLEGTEIRTTTRVSRTNYSGNKDINYGAVALIPLGKSVLGLSYQRIGDDTLALGSAFYESRNRYYGQSTENAVTNVAITEQSRSRDAQHIFILNLGIGKAVPSTNSPALMPEPFFLLQTRFIIFQEHETVRNKKRGIYDSDPSGLISASLFNKMIVEGDGSDPLLEEDTVLKGYKLEVQPRLTLKAGPSLAYHVHLLFGYGLSLSYSNSSRSVESYTNLSTDAAGLFQDKVQYFSESRGRDTGEGDYLKYGLRIEQIFRPKYFLVGLALSAAVEHDTLTYSGKESRSEKTTRTSTFTNHHMSDDVTEKQYRLVEYPDTRINVEQKNITTTLSLPAGFEFDVLNWLKFRISYTVSLKTTFSRTVTSATNGGQTVTTTYYEDPAVNATVVYASTGSYTETVSSVTASARSVSQTFSSGFQIILSRKAVMNIAGTYVLSDTAVPEASLAVESKFLF